MSVTTTDRILADGICDELGAPMETEEAAGLAELFQALGDPTRLRILSVLDTARVLLGDRRPR
ncbi:hypothetical protein [Ferrimicrobium acidiphilum]|uniref:HTH arsR-type domain-containing protein n=1 Tax=Ferrimicrobium acidiphilum TaxID=121039 RepID=A0ABV3Y7I3_9ACTN